MGSHVPPAPSLTIMGEIVALPLRLVAKKDHMSAPQGGMVESVMTESDVASAPPAAVRVNLFRTVTDHGTAQVGIIDLEIAKLEERLTALRRERVFTDAIVHLVTQYQAGDALPSLPSPSV